MITDAGFVGAKAALFCGDALLTILRDTHPGLAWAGMWDLPGGGRDGDESPETCLLREVAEELGLRLSPTRLIWRIELPSMTNPFRPSHFFAGTLTLAEVATIRFGDEGQGWALMQTHDFLNHSHAIPEMQRRVQLALSAVATPQ
jgi:8-oxo-dGTP diphosphatase